MRSAFKLRIEQLESRRMLTCSAEGIWGTANGNCSFNVEATSQIANGGMGSSFYSGSFISGDRLRAFISPDLWEYEVLLSARVTGDTRVEGFGPGYNGFIDRQDDIQDLSVKMSSYGTDELMDSTTISVSAQTNFDETDNAFASAFISADLQAVESSNELMVTYSDSAIVDAMVDPDANSGCCFYHESQAGAGGSIFDVTTNFSNYPLQIEIADPSEDLGKLVVLDERTGNSPETTNTGDASRTQVATIKPAEFNPVLVLWDNVAQEIIAEGQTIDYAFDLDGVYSLRVRNLSDGIGQLPHTTQVTITYGGYSDPIDFRGSNWNLDDFEPHVEFDYRFADNAKLAAYWTDTIPSDASDVQQGTLAAESFGECFPILGCLTIFHGPFYPRSTDQNTGLDPHPSLGLSGELDLVLAERPAGAAFLTLIAEPAGLEGDITTALQDFNPLNDFFSVPVSVDVTRFSHSTTGAAPDARLIQIDYFVDEHSSSEDLLPQVGFKLLFEVELSTYAVTVDSSTLMSPGIAADANPFSSGHHTLTIDPTMSDLIPVEFLAALLDENIVSIAVEGEPFRGVYWDEANRVAAVRVGPDFSENVVASRIPNGHSSVSVEFFADAGTPSEVPAPFTASVDIDELMIMTQDKNDRIDLANMIASSTVVAGDGNDEILLGIGDDHLKGGKGDDAYVFGPTTGGDKVLEDSNEVNLIGNLLDFRTYAALSNSELGGVDLDLSSTAVQSVGEQASIRIETDGTMHGAIGTQYDDEIIGNGLNNFLFGHLGGDTLSGQAGLDVIFGSSVSFELAGVACDLVSFDWDCFLKTGGNWLAALLGLQIPLAKIVVDASDATSTDTIHGGEGADFLIGSAGPDVVTSGSGGGVMIGDPFSVGTFLGPGMPSVSDAVAATGVIAVNPMLSAGLALSELIDNQTLQFLGSGRDDMQGGDGSDLIFGGAGNDVIRGDTGFVDVIFAGDGDDRSGGPGTYITQAHHAIVFGGDGNDHLETTSGSNFIFGDGLQLQTGFEITLDFAPDGEDTSGVSFGGLAFPAGIGDDTITLHDGVANFVVGGDGDDTIRSNGSFAFLDFVIGDSLDLGLSFSIDSSELWDANDTAEVFDAFNMVFPGLSGTGEDNVELNHASGALIGFVAGGDDADEIKGNHSGVNLLFGNSGDDRITGRGGLNLIGGGEGDDHLTGNGSANFIFGDAIILPTWEEIRAGSRDLMVDHKLSPSGFRVDETKPGNDKIFGGSEFDFIVGGLGDDWINTGDGFNVGIGGTLLGTVYQAPLELSDHLFPTFKKSWNEFLSRLGLYFSGANRDGNDTILGGSNSDLLWGGAGNDVLSGGQGTDFLVGGDGNDFVDGGCNTCTIDDGDIVLGGPGDDELRGGPGDDILESEHGTDVFYGGSGNDIIHGGDGADQLFGDSGNDTLIGQGGNDLIDGGPGTNIGCGGPGDNVVNMASEASSIFGRVFVDSNENGVRDDSEPWANGWFVELLDENGDLVTTSTTENRDLNEDNQVDANAEQGWYSFECIGSGTFSIRLKEQAGWNSTTSAITTQSIILSSVDINAQPIGLRPTGDFDDSGGLSCLDLDLLYGGAASDGPIIGQYDVDGNGIIDRNDVDHWITSLANSLRGDANIDGFVDVTDFNIWNEYSFSIGSGWCSGDFNVDGIVDGSDFNIWNANKFTNVSPMLELQPSFAEVPKVAKVAKVAKVRPEPNRARLRIDYSTKTLSEWNVNDHLKTWGRSSLEPLNGGTRRISANYLFFEFRMDSVLDILESSLAVFPRLKM